MMINLWIVGSPIFPELNSICDWTDQVMFQCLVVCSEKTRFLRDLRKCSAHHGPYNLQRKVKARSHLAFCRRLP
jgi:hypothetical protein